MKKRDFLKKAGQMALATPLFYHPIILANTTPVVEDAPKPVEDYWLKIRKDYRLKPDYINLESGYYNIIPMPTLKRFQEHVEEINYQGSYYMRTVQWENKTKVARRLAELVNCDPDCLAITRNTTESLDLVISGYPWNDGDEAIFAEQDYGAMQDQFDLVARRYGVVNKVISVPNHPKSDDEIVALYRSQITAKTKLIMVCHMINITGQILPIRKICDMAHEHGVEVLVDGAHCVGHIPVDIPALNCDYYGTSLHKWVATPLGAGFLYVKKSHISKIWPLLAENDPPEDHIRKLNHTGTHPVHTDLAIMDALDYLERMGLERKTARMQYLQRYWSNQLRNVQGVIINTPEAPERSCGIANVGVQGIKPAELAQRLLDEHQIFTVAIDGAGVHGCRITPNVFTTTAELDRFVAAIKELAAG